VNKLIYAQSICPLWIYMLLLAEKVTREKLNWISSIFLPLWVTKESSYL